MCKRLSVLLFALVVAACDSAEFSQNRAAELGVIDEVFSRIDQNAAAIEAAPAFSVDHSRLGEAEGEVLDASKVGLYSNPRVNSLILSANIRAGLDLPYRIQAYYENGKQQLVYTDPEFLRIRHSLDSAGALEDFEQDIAALTTGLDGARPVHKNGLEADLGIVQLVSDFGYEDSIARLKETILAEGDTVWFYDVDYQEEAQAFGIELPRASLLVFGAPAPGAKAMRPYPSIGLDAFPQKLLVYENNGQVLAIYNEIPAMAELHYNDTGIPHYVIAYRLKDTLSDAISVE